MRIHFIECENYRQYKWVRIDFTLDKEKNFTVIKGANGAGKSNLLNAITWCLYGEERHLGADTEGLPILNDKLYDDLEPEGEHKVSVEIALGEETIQYRIRRSATVFKRRDGQVTVTVDNDDPVVKFRQGNDWHISPQPTYTINQILPPEISNFFFFDGEQLDNFFKQDSTSRVRDGIVRVSQISLLDTTLEHLGKVKTDMRRKADGLNPETDKIRGELDNLEQKLELWQEELASLEDDKSGIRENLDAIQRKFSESDRKVVRDLQKQRNDLNSQISDNETSLKQEADRAARTLRKLGPRVYAHEALTKTLYLIEQEAKKGDLPPKVREPFFKDLLDMQVCVCDRTLEEGSGPWQSVVNRMQTTTESNYENALEGRYKLKQMLDEIDSLAKEQTAIGQTIWGIEEGITSARKSLAEISEKMEKFGEINEQEIKVLETQHRSYQGEYDRVVEEIGIKKDRLSELKKSMSQRAKDYRDALSADQRQQDLLSRVTLCDNAFDALEGIREELLSEVREQIQSQTERYFLDLIWKKGTYKQVEISEDYTINVLNIRGMPSLGTLSAGERQVLALAFVAALTKVSGFHAPIVIDTPMGRISGEPRLNIAESLPNYLKDSQITMLVTDTEYTDDFRKRIDSRVGKEYSLEFDEAADETRVI